MRVPGRETLSDKAVRGGSKRVTLWDGQSDRDSAQLRGCQGWGWGEGRGRWAGRAEGLGAVGCSVRGRDDVGRRRAVQTLSASTTKRPPLVFGAESVSSAVRQL